MPNDQLVQLNSGYDVANSKDWDNTHPYQHRSDAFYDRVDEDERVYNLQQAQIQ